MNENHLFNQLLHNEVPDVHQEDITEPCIFCLPHIEVIEKIAPDIFFCKNKDDYIYYLVTGDDYHIGKIVWSSTPPQIPWPMPDIEPIDLDENFDEGLYKLYDTWMDVATSEMFLYNIDEATNSKVVKGTKINFDNLRDNYRFVQNLTEAGYDPVDDDDPNLVEYWLYDKMGAILGGKAIFVADEDEPF